jgi:hypothetical protein
VIGAESSGDKWHFHQQGCGQQQGRPAVARPQGDGGTPRALLEQGQHIPKLRPRVRDAGQGWGSAASPGSQPDPLFSASRTTGQAMVGAGEGAGHVEGCLRFETKCLRNDKGLCCLSRARGREAATENPQTHNGERNEQRGHNRQGQNGRSPTQGL